VNPHTIDPFHRGKVQLITFMMGLFDLVVQTQLVKYIYIDHAGAATNIRPDRNRK